MDFKRKNLLSDEFQGFLSINDLRDGMIKQVPKSGGVYVVLRELDRIPKFLNENPGGRFKGKNPTVDKFELKSNWIEGSHTIYIGKGDKLQRRMKQFLDFGAGKKIGHWGGRMVWQIENSNHFIIAWKSIEDQDPATVESQLLTHFSSNYGKLPFANLRF